MADFAVDSSDNLLGHPLVDKLAVAVHATQTLGDNPGCLEETAGMAELDDRQEVVHLTEIGAFEIPLNNQGERRCLDSADRDHGVGAGPAAQNRVGARERHRPRHSR